MTEEIPPNFMLDAPCLMYAKVPEFFEEEQQDVLQAVYNDPRSSIGLPPGAHVTDLSDVVNK